MDEWVKIPTGWIIKDRGLRRFTWSGEDRANYIAALMLYISIAHHILRKPTRKIQLVGFAKLSYTNLSAIADLSRAKIAAGIQILLEHQLINKSRHEKINIYSLLNYETRGGWAKLPCMSLYDRKHESIVPFNQFNLRHRTELHALKLYLLLIALRDNQKNHAVASYEKIQGYTAIAKNDIRSAISLLIHLGMIHVNRLDDANEPNKGHNLYRICGIDNNRHLGTLSPDLIDGALIDDYFQQG